MATGGLSVPNTPDIWASPISRAPPSHRALPQEPVDFFEGKRVGIIGTGPGVQAIPMIAQTARQLVVFQRTPNFGAGAQSPADRRGPQELRRRAGRLSREPRAIRLRPRAADGVRWPRCRRASRPAGARYEQLWNEGGSAAKAFPNILVHPDVNEVCADFVRQKIRETVKDPKTAETLSPSGYPFGVKRLCVDTDYFDTYNRSNVELVNLRDVVDREDHGPCRRHGGAALRAMRWSSPPASTP